MKYMVAAVDADQTAFGERSSAEPKNGLLVTIEMNHWGQGQRPSVAGRLPKGALHK